MGQESTREALIDDLWRLVKTNGLGARERTGKVLDELERRGLLKLSRWRCDRCLQFTDQGGGHGPGFCTDRRYEIADVTWSASGNDDWSRARLTMAETPEGWKRVELVDGVWVVQEDEPVQ